MVEIRLHFENRDEMSEIPMGCTPPLMQIFLEYLYERGVRSWPSGCKLKDALHDGLSNDPLAVHHVFPKKFMQDQDFPIERSNTVANYAILL